MWFGEAILTDDFDANIFKIIFFKKHF
eukprot:SAG31_NODE_508_length_14732_cov_75.624547_1_plen_26_part_10